MSTVGPIRGGSRLIVALLPARLGPALLHRQGRGQPAVLGDGDDVAPAVGGGAGHEADMEEGELGLALARPDEDAAVGCLGHGFLNGDAGIAVVVRRKPRQQDARQAGVKADGERPHLVDVGGIDGGRLQRRGRRIVGACGCGREGCRRSAGAAAAWPKAAVAGSRAEPRWRPVCSMARLGEAWRQ